VRGPAGRIAEIAVVAAAYAALTIAFGLMSYASVQFRFAEILKPLVIWEPQLIPAFVLGNFLGNLASPFGLPDLTWMPFANLVGAWTCWRLGRINAYLGAAAYALITAAAVSTMLMVLLGVPFRPLFLPLLAGEVILIVGGVPVMRPVHLALRRAFGDRENNRIGT